MFVTNSSSFDKRTLIIANILYLENSTIESLNVRDYDHYFDEDYKKNHNDIETTNHHDSIINRIKSGYQIETDDNTENR